MNDIAERLDAVKKALERLRLRPVADEYQLHEEIAAALNSGGFVVAHEVRLAPRSRVDLVVDRIAIEVKRGKPPRAALLSQCTRYLASPEVDALILVTEKSVSLPGHLGGKPVAVVSLNKLWGIALP